MSCAQNIQTYNDNRTSSEASSAVKGTTKIQGKTAGINGDPGREFTLQRIVHNRSELEHFRMFLSDNFASDDLNCWLDIEALRRVTDRLRAARASLVVRKYFNDGYFYGPTSPANKQEQDKV